MPTVFLLFTVAANSATIRGQSPSPADPPGWQPLSVSAEGRALRAFLDGMAVERYWLRTHDRILWETGEPFEVRDGHLMQRLGKDETHCSAFVAAAAERLGIYMLRPPEHSHILLANAQYGWLQSQRARELGWSSVATAIEAQQLANRGVFVVAVVKNPDPKAAGHIAVIAPCQKPADRIAIDGPEICQAGFSNYRAAALRRGFRRHPGAWKAGGEGAVRFFANSSDPSRIGDVTWTE